MTPIPPVPASQPERRRSRLPFAALVVIVIGVVVALMVANGGFRGGRADAASPPPSTPGVVPSDTGVVAEGRAVPVRAAELAAGAAGRVAEVAVKEGDPVDGG